MTTERVAAPQAKPPLWRNETFLKWAAQLGVFARIVALFWVLGSQAATNLDAQGREFSFRFLSDPAPQISEGIFTLPQDGLASLGTGIVNMLRVTVSGIIAASFLGVIVGVSRLSSNWLLSKSATVFVEIIRNIPLLVLIIFFALLCSLFFPVLPNEASGPMWLIFTRNGVSLPWLFPTETFWQWGAFLALGVVAGVITYRRRDRLREQTGQNTHAPRYTVGAFLIVAAIGWFAHPIAGALGWIWQLLESIVSAVPVIAFQILFAGVAVFLAVRWIRAFLDSLRSPAGLAKLNDDDYFRIGLAGVVGFGAAVVFLFVPSITQAINDGAEFMFGFFDQKFEFLRTGTPLEFRRPEIVRPANFASIGPQGMTMTPAFFGLWVGVTLFTAANIGEIVRGGVMAVPKGQTEAGLAMGLRRSQLLRLVVLPQALRIILPPIGNQYLNLAKNTSLGIAVAFPDVVGTMTTLANQSGQYLPVLLIWMGFYLTVSLTLSSIVNYYNRKLKLVER
jgi:general L-amino acid transport system permease protein